VGVRRVDNWRWGCSQWRHVGICVPSTGQREACICWDKFSLWYVEVFITIHPTYDRSPPTFRFYSIFILWNYKLNISTAGIILWYFMISLLIYSFSKLHYVTFKNSVIYKYYTCFEVLRVGFVKNSTFCNETPCRPLEVNWCFGVIFYLLHQQLPVSCWVFALLILRPWKWRQHIPRKHQFIFNWLHGILLQTV
jgi:hypothetical protein